MVIDIVDHVDPRAQLVLILLGSMLQFEISLVGISNQIVRTDVILLSMFVGVR